MTNFELFKYLTEVCEFDPIDAEYSTMLVDDYSSTNDFANDPQAMKQALDELKTGGNPFDFDRHGEWTAGRIYRTNSTGYYVMTADFGLIYDPETDRIVCDAVVPTYDAALFKIYSNITEGSGDNGPVDETGFPKALELTVDGEIVEVYFEDDVAVKWIEDRLAKENKRRKL